MDSPVPVINSNDGLNNDYKNNNNQRKKLISGSSSDSPIVQDSPFFKYISNLSPIELDKGAPVAQGFSVLSSPPLVITSPRENLHENLLKRSQESNASGLGISENDNKHLSMDGVSDNPGKVDDESSDALIPTIPKDCVNKDLEQVQSSSPSVCVDELLADAENEEYASSSQRKLFDHATQSSQGELAKEKDKKNNGDANPDGSATSFEQGDKYSQGVSKAEVRLTKSKSRLQIPSSTDNLDIVSKSSTDHVFDLQHDGVSFSEAGHLQRGTLRRCLQFNENQWKPTADGCGYYVPVHTENNLQEPSDVLSTPTSINRQSLNPSHLMNTTSVSSFSGYPISAVARPRGIGLHLNSIVTTEPVDGVRLSMQSDNVVRIKGKSSIVVTENQFASSSDCSSITTSVVENISSQMEMNASNVHEEAVSPMSLPTCSLKSSNMLKRPATPYDEKTCYSHVAASNHESSQGSPKKRRKKDPGSTDDDGCKRCNCKKSKCLKLYCECFAAGFYCGESCACQGCLNKTEYEDTVIETRQQIISRNPLAFAPKVVQRVTVSPANSRDAGNSILPSSLRHKSGCNCKKSMCLKKYCECYQANVGCSDGCRCEGCRNVYGRKQDTSMRRQTSVRTADEMSEHLSEAKHIAVPTRDGVLRDEAHDSPNLTRITPSLLCLDLRKNALKGHLPSGRYLISPDFNQILSSSEKHSTSRNLQGDHMHLESKTDSININSNDVEQVSEKLGEGSQFSSFSGGLANVCNITPLSNPFPETVVPASERRDSRYISGLQSCAGGGLSPPTSSLRWRSSPINPCTKFGGQKFHQDFDSDGKQCNTQEDDTPDILMDSSIKAVKVSSPNKKRISPPHNHNDELKTSPSESLKSGRRFVLRAVPRFPPLTSCLDSKDGNNENKIKSSGS